MAKTPIQLHGLEYTCTCCLNSALLLHGCPCKHMLGCVCWDVCVGVCVRGYAVCICAVGHPVSISTLTDMDGSTQLLSLIQTEPPEPDSGSQRSLSCHMVALFIFAPQSIHSTLCQVTNATTLCRPFVDPSWFPLLFTVQACCSWNSPASLWAYWDLWSFDLVFSPIKYFRTRPISSVRVTH